MARHWKALMFGVALALVAASCGGGEAVTPDANGVVTIELSEFSFSPDTIKVSPGQTVTFKLVNKGEKEHEFMIGRDVDTSPGYPNGFEHDFFEGMMVEVMPMDAAMNMDMGMEGDGDMSDDMSGEMSEGDGDHAGHTGFMVVRQPDEEATITVTIPADASGEWEIGCFEEDGAHWDDGMRGKLIIES